MSLEPLAANDARVENRFLDVGNGLTYHYMVAKPTGSPVATAVLIHGWPDLGMAWRYQVPYLTALGIQVVVPDMLGYGQTSAPDEHEQYTMKKMTSHVSLIIRATTDQPVILGGHDWGGHFVWRMAMYHPSLVRAIFSYCVPYMPPSPEILTTAQLAERMPNFAYQAYLASGAVEAAVGDSSELLSGFIRGNFNATTVPDGLPIFTPGQGIHVDRLARVGPSPLMGSELEDYYVAQYRRHGLRGPCNWYRTHELNSRDELPLAQGTGAFQFQVPAMLVMAEKDPVLLPEMADGQGIFFAAGLKTEVVAGSSHWIMVEKPDEANRHLGDFVKSVLG